MSGHEPSSQRLAVPGTMDELQKTLADLRESEEKYHRIVETSQEGIWSMDGQYVTTYVNEAMGRMLGYEPGEILGRKVHEFMFKQDLGDHSRKMERRHKGENQVYERRFRRKDGSELWTIVSATSLMDEAGKFNGSFAMFTDITDRKQAEEQVASARSFLQNVQDALSVHMAILDEAGSIVQVNDAWAQFGQQNGLKCGNTCVGANYLEVCDQASGPFSEEAEQAAQAIRDVLAGKQKVVSFEYPCHGPQEKRWFLATITGFLEEGRPWVVVTHQNITRRKQIEEELQKSEKKYRTLFESADDSILLSDLKGNHLFANSAYYTSLGFAPGEDENPDGFTRLHPDDAPKLTRQMQELFDKGTVSFEYRVLHKKGYWIDRAAKLTLVHEDQAPKFILSIVRDITERKLAEEAIRQVERRARALLEHAPDGIVFVSPEGNFTFASPSARRLFGYEIEELSQLSPNELTHPQDLPMVLEEIGGLLNDPTRVTTIQYRFRHKDGRWLWIESTFSNLIAEPSIAAIVINFRDITERKRAERKLQESEARFSAVFNFSPIPVSLTDPETEQWVEVNDAFLHTTGYSREEVAERTFRDLNLWANPEQRSEMKKTLMEHGKVNNLEVEINKKDGTRGIMLISAEMISLNDRPYLLIMGNEITVRKLAEEKVRQRSEELAALNLVSREISASLNVEHASSAGMRGILEAAHPDLALLFLCEEGKLILKEVLPENAQVRLGEIPEHRVGECMCGLAVKENRALYTHDVFSDQRCTWDECKRAKVKAFAALPLRSGNEVIGVIGLGSDTERDFSKQAEFLETLASQVSVAVVNARLFEASQDYAADLEHRVEERTRELRDAQEKLVRQEKLAVLGQLAGGVGHELRNPLSVITNALYLLRLLQADSRPQVQEYLGIIEQETHNAEKIINDLLEFSRTKSVDREPVPVKGMLETILERFPVPGNVTVKFKLPADLPPVFADPRHLQQIFGNLTTNACQAMADGGTLTLSAKKKGEEVAIAVEDTGMGIPPENMAKLFEPLFTTKAKGIGLGLAVSRKLVEANGGRLEVQSTPGAGSTFTVYLKQPRDSNE